MTLTDQVYTQALLMAGGLEARLEVLLKVLCRSALVSLEARLRDGLTAEDCKADLVAAASLYALAALSEAGEAGEVEQFAAGDVTVRRRGGGAAANCLRYQAELLIGPYLKDGFAFLGV